MVYRKFKAKGKYMKFLIGVCGIGKGHCIREYEICKELIKRGHEVRILTYNEGVDFFQILI